MDIRLAKQRGLSSGGMDREEALALYRAVDVAALGADAAAIRRHFTGNRLDTCSIINAR